MHWHQMSVDLLGMQGDRLDNILPVGIFRKDEVAQRNGNILGYFLHKQIYYIFT